MSLKYTEGFTRLLPGVVTVAGMILSFVLLAHALRQLPLGVAYAIWTGIGTIGTVLVSVLVLGEHITGLQVLCLAFIVVGIVGLRLLSA